MFVLTARRTALALGAGAALLAGPLVASSAQAGTGDHEPACRSGDPGTVFARTELYFGLSRSDGPPITPGQFDRFVDREVTPRFPDGLTVLKAEGQFKDSTGTIVEEGSRVIILLHPAGDPDSSVRIEQIRERYKHRFQQESVLRTDDTSCVSF
ncbi:MAG TPA: DUF3574 domain-containing protein [Jatrophihabitantaceae bacterium]